MAKTFESMSMEELKPDEIAAVLATHHDLDQTQMEVTAERIVTMLYGDPNNDGTHALLDAYVSPIEQPYTEIDEQGEVTVIEVDVDLDSLALHVQSDFPSAEAPPVEPVDEVVESAPEPRPEVEPGPGMVSGAVQGYHNSQEEPSPWAGSTR